MKPYSKHSHKHFQFHIQNDYCNIDNGLSKYCHLNSYSTFYSLPLRSILHNIHQTEHKHHINYNDARNNNVNLQTLYKTHSFRKRNDRQRNLPNRLMYHKDFHLLQNNIYPRTFHHSLHMKAIPKVFYHSIQPNSLQVSGRNFGDEIRAISSAG